MRFQQKRRGNQWHRCYDCPTEPWRVGPPVVSAHSENDTDQQHCRHEHCDCQEVPWLEFLAPIARRQRKSLQYCQRCEWNGELDQMKVAPVVLREHLDGE